MKRKTATTIRVTDDYSKFGLTQENRGVVAPHVKQLAVSMRRHGWIDAFPMMVVDRGGKLEIRDGQNRFEAARMLGLPVKFVIANNGQGDIPIAELNSKQKTWNTLDYCKSYANKGDPSYQTLLRFMDEEGIPIMVASALLAQSSTGAAVIKSGNFEVVDVEWARYVSNYLRRLKAVMPWSPYCSKFARVYMKACLVHGFWPEVFESKVSKFTDKCLQMATEVGTAQMMEALYNHRNKRPIPLAYEISRIVARNRTEQPARRKAALKRWANERKAD